MEKTLFDKLVLRDKLDMMTRVWLKESRSFHNLYMRSILEQKRKPKKLLDTEQLI